MHCKYGDSIFRGVDYSYRSGDSVNVENGSHNKLS